MLLEELYEQYHPPKVLKDLARTLVSHSNKNHSKNNFCLFHFYPHKTVYWSVGKSMNYFVMVLKCFPAVGWSNNQNISAFSTTMLQGRNNCSQKFSFWEIIFLQSYLSTPKPFTTTAINTFTWTKTFENF